MALKPVKGIVAIPPSKTDLAEDELLTSEITDEQFEEFRQAGWRFVLINEGSEDTPTSAKRGIGSIEDTRKPGATEGAQAQVLRSLSPRRVYRDSAGRIVIDGAAIVVRFEPEIQPGEIKALLDSHGLEIKRRLGFVRNGYQVVPKDADTELDLLEIADRLGQLSEVEYAEPVTIEVLVKRR